MFLFLTYLLIYFYLLTRQVFQCFIAGFYTETISLDLLTSMWPIRIECRAFLKIDGIPVVPCCNNSNHKTLCQPDTGIARVIVDIVYLTDPTASLFCQPGVDLNYARPLVVDCQSNDQPKYCPNATKNDFGIQNSSKEPNDVDEIQNWLPSSKKPRGKRL